MSEHQGKIKLFVLPKPETWKVPNSSPPCGKVETWLRITGIPYEQMPFAMPPTPPPPKGQWPYIEDNGTVVGDSTLIIEHLKRSRKIDPDEGLTAEQRAVSLFIRRMVKDNLYALAMHVRFREDSGWHSYSSFLKPMVLGMAGGNEQGASAILDNMRQKALDNLNTQGLGRDTLEEVQQIADADLTALSDFLGTKPFLFGDKPTTADATVYAYLACIIDVPLDGPITRAARSRQNLVDYSKRMRERYFGELSG